MGKIFVLDENTANKIAAGEVIERPASVVKELLENSIDAGATVITVEIAKGGIALIKVADNGSGIEEDDVRTAFERHATSKIRNAENLNTISTLGFRGEALASIAAVSKVVMATRTVAAGYGTRIEIEGGRIKETGKTGCPEGTSITIRELFYNTPARYKFLKNNSTEARYVTDVVNKIALGNPHVSIRYFSDSVEILHTPGNNDLLSTIYCIYGKQTVDNCIRLEGENETMKVEGFIGSPSIARSNRAGQSFYVNGRYVKSPLLTSAVDEAYKTFLMKGKHPFIVLKATTSFELVDVNVHPTKLQVRFYNEQDIFRLVYHSIRNALFNAPGIGNADLFKTVPQETNEGKTTAAGTGVDTSDRRQVFLKERDEFGSCRDIFEYDWHKSHVTGTGREAGRDAEQSGGTMQPGALIQSDEELQPGMSIRPGAEMQNDVALEHVGTMHPGALLQSDGELQPGMSMHPGAQIQLDVALQHGGAMQPGAIIQSDGELQPGMSMHSGAALQADNQRKILREATVIGQVFMTYLLLQHRDTLYILDQHAAHEKVVYEKLVREYEKNTPFSQMLVSPVVIELSNSEIQFLEEKIGLFNDIGYIYEKFGNNSIILRSVPYPAVGGSIKNEFISLLGHMMEYNTDRIDLLAREALYRIACSNAVKAGSSMDKAEAVQLIKDLSMLDNPFTCPHGRPTVIRIEKQELEKRFGRK